MSCQTFDEIVNITINSKNELSDYSLNKQNCLKSVGNPQLLLNILKNKSIDEIEKMDFENDILTKLTKKTLLHEVIYQKHFRAIKNTLEIYNGHARNHKLIQKIKFHRDNSTQIQALVPYMFEMPSQSQNVCSCGVRVTGHS
ncbi:MAG: hypothetical protein UR27_C0005G0028 [Candidatus Peregrinibacteria bacterium GW2011_GWA2_33_10]|nr:MAG: hypothetical protein UR27_C0005G0028 [Candidatus Peregrinibacteria bacterium GW2011_GWA2_33_10]KKP39286.1 MAG: hypothetical protein UR30_C0011G0029 [Candidatus Peregrinibacteria bacterium GW2011_GWC2_33_13]